MTHRHLIACLVFVSTLVLPFGLAAQNSDRAQADEAARSGVTDFGRGPVASVKADLGLRSPQDFEQAELGKPLPMYLVRLDELAGYSPTADPRILLKDMNSFIYPISVGTQVKSSVQVAKMEGKWKAVAIGRSGFIKSVMESLSRIEKSEGKDEKLVEIPGLNAYFIGWSRGDDLVLTPLADDSALGLKVGNDLSAKATFGKLSEEAKKAIEEDGVR
jgi:hypothetical protein